MNRHSEGLSRRGLLGLGASAIAAAVLPVRAVSAMPLPQLPVLPRVRIDTVIECICLNFGISREMLLSPDRSRYVVKARQYGMYLSRSLTTRSLPEIGRRFGNRDHTTVLHAVRKIEALMQADAYVKCDIAYFGECAAHMQAIKAGVASAPPDAWQGPYKKFRP